MGGSNSTSSKRKGKRYWKKQQQHSTQGIQVLGLESGVLSRILGGEALH